MLPWIAGAIVLGVGAYLLDEAKSENRRARERYEDEYASASSSARRAYKKSDRKHQLDSLFKMKYAKRKVADAIYKEMKQLERDFREINLDLKRTKDMLGLSFQNKKMANCREEKREIQNHINLIQATRAELFPFKDEMKEELSLLKVKLRKANRETSNIQKQINQVLEK